MSEYQPMPAFAVKKLIRDLFFSLTAHFKDAAYQYYLMEIFDTYETKYKDFHYPTPIYGEQQYNYLVLNLVLPKERRFCAEAELYPDVNKNSYPSIWPLPTYLVIACIKHIFSYECVVFNPLSHAFSLGPFQDNDEFLNNALGEFLPENSARMEPLRYNRNLKPIQLLPIYEYIFKYLKNCGLDWDYLNFELLCLRIEYDDMAYYESGREKRDFEKMLYLKHGIDLDPWDIDAIQAALKRMFLTDRWGNRISYFDYEQYMYAACDLVGDIPLTGDDDRLEKFELELERLQGLPYPDSSKLVAYHNVYGKYPKGYPIDAKDYATENYLPFNHMKR
jgi:hypothetical protein